MLALRRAVVLLALSSLAWADDLSQGELSDTCPLDGTTYRTRAVLLGEQTGLRLDLKPVVSGAMESPIPRCPKCSYVGGPWREDDLEVLRTTLSSGAFKSDPVVARSNHAARAMLRAATEPQEVNALAFEWLHASWELEHDLPLWKLATERALEAFVASARTAGTGQVHFGEPTELETQRTAKLMQVELLRRLARFDEAQAALNALAALPEFKRGAYPTLVETERTLVAKKNAAPQPFPKMPAFDPHEDDLAWVTARATPGFKAFEAAFVIENARLESDAVNFSLRSREPKALDSIWWDMPLKNGVATQTWSDLLALHRQLDALVKKNPWLEDWKRGSEERHIELWLRDRPFEYLEYPAWKASGFRGRPVAKLLLREGVEAVATLFLAAEGGAVVTSAGQRDELFTLLGRKPPEKKTPEHWLTAKPVSYHPRGNPPEFMRVSADGKSELRRTAVFTMEQLDALEVEFEQFMKDGAP